MTQQASNQQENQFGSRSMSAVQTIEATTPATTAADASAIIHVIERAAMNPDVDIDKMERLLQMQERIMERNARSAFSSAFADMQGDLPEIKENGKGHGSIRYALWEDVNSAIKPVLQMHGFGLSFKTGRAADKITVTGILSHREGHSEETTMELPCDQSGSKNAVQAVGSSTSYGKRYVAMALLNLTSRLSDDRDDDGKASSASAFINDEQAAQIRELISETGADIARFCAHMSVEAIPELPAAKFKAAIDALNKKRGRS